MMVSRRSVGMVSGIILTPIFDDFLADDDDVEMSDGNEERTIRTLIKSGLQGVRDPRLLLPIVSG